MPDTFVNWTSHVSIITIAVEFTRPLQKEAEVQCKELRRLGIAELFPFLRLIKLPRRLEKYNTI